MKQIFLFIYFCLSIFCIWYMWRWYWYIFRNIGILSRRTDQHNRQFIFSETDFSFCVYIFEMLTPTIYFYFLLFLMMRIIHSQGNSCVCKYVFYFFTILDIMWISRVHTRVSIIFFIGDQPDSDFASGVNLIYYKWFVFMKEYLKI